MRFYIILFISLVSFSSFASDDSEVRDLFNRYERVVSGHETELIDEVFSARFLKDNGGKDEFADKVKSIPKSSDKSMPLTMISWKKAAKSENLMVKLKPSSKDKSVSKQSENDFIVVRENGKLKIDGTVGDAN